MSTVRFIVQDKSVMYQLSHFSKKLDLGMALFMDQPYLASYGNSQVTFRLRNRHGTKRLAEREDQ